MATAPAFVHPAQAPLTYQHRLRAVGRQLDLDGYRGVTIMEVAGGMVAHGVQIDGRGPIVMEIPDTEFPTLLENAVAARGRGERHGHHPLLPTGYEDFLRALGWWLDQQRAGSVRIVECVTVVAVLGWTARQTARATQLEPFEVFLGPAEIQARLDEAFQQRSQRRRSPLLAWMGS